MRDFFVVLAGIALIISLWQWRVVAPHEGKPVSMREILVSVRDAFRSKSILRWLVLIQAADLMLDVLMAFLALYLVYVEAISPAQAAIAVSVWTGVGLLGDALLIPLLSKVNGLTYLRVSACIVLVLFPAFLLAPWFPVKLVLLGLLGCLNAGWYAILKAQVYAALPERSGTALALFNLSCLAGAAVPVLLGVLAETFGLALSMWLLILGPIALIVGIRKKHMVAKGDLAELGDTLKP